VAAGPQGLPNEFIKYARYRERLQDGKQGPMIYLLVGIMVKLFNGLLALGSIPPSWLATAIRPVPKTAEPSTLNDTRPIAVGSSIPKLFAATFNARLVHWAEARNKRAPQQAGFRPRMSTTHHLFALRHMIDWHRSAGEPLYMAFVDFSKAYDSVNRTLLWHKLEHLGVRGAFLKTLQGLYDGDGAYVQLDGCRTERFLCTTGVKQGCPLSPTLFSLYFDHVADYLTHGRVTSPSIPGIGPLNSLLYADDVVVFANSAQDLNWLMGGLEFFCNDWDMAVNVDKTKVMVVGNASQRSKKTAIKLQGRTLEYVDSYKYLGIEVEAATGFNRVPTTRARATERSLHAMHGRCARMGLWGSLDLRLRLFDILVAPVAEYAAAAWAPGPLLKPCLQPSSDLERVHRQFLLTLLHLPTCTPVWPLYEECGRLPWQARWLHEAAKLWRRTFRHPAPQLDMHAAILKHNVALFGQHSPQFHGSWAGGFRAAMESICAPEEAAALGQSFEACEDIDPAVLLAALRRHYHELAYDGAGTDPRAETCAHRKYAAYLAWCRRPVADDYQADFRKHSYVCHPELPAAQIRQVARVRLGCHPKLPAHAAQSSGLPAAHRAACTRCGAGAAGDAMHLLWECPATDAPRAVRAAALSGLSDCPDRMKGLLNHPNQREVARFVIDCLAAW
jgi:hypothetical protein